MMEKETTFTFKCLERQSAELKIRLKYDKMQQTTLFQSLLELYIESDPLMMELVDKIKESKALMGKRKRAMIARDFSAGRRLMKDLSISALDKDKLFDIIESGDELEYE